MYAPELVSCLADLDDRAELLINLLPFTLVGAFVGVLVPLVVPDGLIVQSTLPTPIICCAAIDSQ